MKRLFFTLAAAILTYGAAFAQQEEKITSSELIGRFQNRDTWGWMLESKGGTQLDGNDTKVRLMNLTGYFTIPWNKYVSTSIIVDGGVGLFRRYRDLSDKGLGKQRTYDEFFGLGAEVAVNAFRIADNSLVQFAVGAGNTIDSEWKFFFTDLSARWFFVPREPQCVLPYITFGVRYMNGQSSRFDNNWIFNAGVGCRLNW